MLSKLTLILTDGRLLRRLGFVVLALALYRGLAAIPLPSVDTAKLFEFFSNNQFFGFLNLFSGGSLDNLSLVMLGVGPYITASIIVQLGTMMSPKLKMMQQEEGEIGRKKVQQYSRFLTLPIAFLQGFAFLRFLSSQGVFLSLDTQAYATNLLMIVAGSILAMWIGELISEFGIGNGVSMVIFAGIVAQLPVLVSQQLFSLTQADIPLYLGMFAFALFVIALIVFVTEAERSVPVTYAKRVAGTSVLGGNSTYLPLRLNQAGVIPIIFALSILFLPQIVATGLTTFVKATWVVTVSQAITAFMANQWAYGAVYFVLVFLFTYFYTAVTFDPIAISKRLQQSGAFVPGVRPGEATASYLGTVVGRTTLIGATFLAVVAVLPLLLQGITGVQAFAIGGTSLLIVVSVVLDLIKKIDAQATLREY